jgi:hypothetical protein
LAEPLRNKIRSFGNTGQWLVNPAQEPEGIVFRRMGRCLVRSFRATLQMNLKFNGVLSEVLGRFRAWLTGAVNADGFLLVG